MFADHNFTVFADLTVTVKLFHMHAYCVHALRAMKCSLSVRMLTRKNLTLYCIYSIQKHHIPQHYTHAPALRACM